MSNMIAAVSSAALFALTSFGAIAPASAAPNNMRMHNDPGQQQQFVMSWCQRHPGDNSCGDFGRNHNRWSNSQYRNFYQSHHNTPGFDPLAAGIFGFAAGAVVAGAAAAASSANASDDSDHIAACQQAYRSYNVDTDSYMGYDNARHQCML